MNNPTPENAETHLIVRLSSSDLKLLADAYDRLDFGGAAEYWNACKLAIEAVQAAVERAEDIASRIDPEYPIDYTCSIIDGEHVHTHSVPLNHPPDMRTDSRVPTRVHPDDACADHSCALIHPGVNHATYTELCGL